MMAWRRAAASEKPWARANSSFSSGILRRTMRWAFTRNTAAFPASSGVYCWGKVTWISRSSSGRIPATCSSKPSMNMPLPSSRG